MLSPYAGLPVEAWKAKTLELIKQHPLNSNEICELINQVWHEIFESNITSSAYKIGIDLFPRPQIMGYFLHELIPLELARKYPNIWRREENNNEKDIVCITNEYYSIEMKTSSSKRSIYGNRSYAQKSTTNSRLKKNKSGYCLAINFEKFNRNNPAAERPKITLVRFGWLDQDDWQGQVAATGQQAKLSLDVERYKLLELPL
ncbi:MAG: ScaI family restriction endonuclease [Okeania sp. SIO3I5]|uniref:ScaI family restriction endonuclease n=1 Tax=Okeania sp. SIO3I5 TaxID=2607805 RepID=UPI0013B777D7|nr:ScaI family restriction endonuclease [Okeania sp. SIO3I5]NEQ40710.1 ScaI family restriction endonuclease [Okeania sp. SIO3I5]